MAKNFPGGPGQGWQGLALLGEQQEPALQRGSLRGMALSNQGFEFRLLFFLDAISTIYSKSLWISHYSASVQTPIAYI